MNNKFSDMCICNSKLCTIYDDFLHCSNRYCEFWKLNIEENIIDYFRTSSLLNSIGKQINNIIIYDSNTIIISNPHDDVDIKMACNLQLNINDFKNIQELISYFKNIENKLIINQYLE